jgi:hypothetical protein
MNPQSSSTTSSAPATDVTPSSTWRESLAYALPGILGFFTFLLSSIDEARGVLEHLVIVIAAVLGGATIQGGAFLAILVAVYFVGSVAGSKNPGSQLLIRERYILPGVALLVVALWSVGLYRDYELRRRIEKCAREIDQNPYMVPREDRYSIGALVYWCFERDERSSRYSHDDE